MPKKNRRPIDDRIADLIERMNVRHEAQSHAAVFNPLWEPHDDGTTTASCCEESR